MRRRALGLLFVSLISVCCERRPGRPTDRISIAVPYEIDTLDPHARNVLGYFSIASHFYEALVTTDANMQIQPCLARRWENPDLSTWVFHLQPTATFHDGKPLRSEDVVYSFERLLKARDLGMTGYVLYIAEVTPVDPLTIRIRTTRPLSILLNKLRFVAIIPKGSTPEQLRERPNGTGPYRLAAWRKGESIRVVRNDHYWAKEPPLREVNFFLDRSPEKAMQSLLSGQCQFIQANSRRLQSALHGAERFELLRRPSLFLKYLGYDLSREETPYCSVKPNPFRDRRVRQAINLAVDRRRLVAGLSTYAVPAYQLVPPFIFGFNPRIASPPYDPARARALLREARLEGGFDVTLHVRKIFAEAAFLVRDQLRPFGIRVDAKVLGDPEFLETAARREPTFHLSRFGCPTGDASDILDTALHTTDAARHFGVNNYGGYSNPEVDRAIEDSSGIHSVDQRRAVLQQIMAALMDDLVWIPLYIDEDVYAIEKSFSWRPRNDGFILAAEIAPR